MLPTRINARVSGALAAHIEKMVGYEGLYETPSEYIRDLIRKDMATASVKTENDHILAGYRDLAEGRYFQSTGDFTKDMEILRDREAKGWA